MVRYIPEDFNTRAIRERLYDKVKQSRACISLSHKQSLRRSNRRLIRGSPTNPSGTYPQLQLLPRAQDADGMVAMTSTFQAGRKRKWVKNACFLPYLKAISLFAQDTSFSSHQTKMGKKKKKSGSGFTGEFYQCYEGQRKMSRFLKSCYEASKIFIPKPDQKVKFIGQFYL